MKTLRLITTYDCPRDCVGCCNKQKAFVDHNIPVFNGKFFEYDRLIITGGEPLLNFDALKRLISFARILHPHINIIVYTANVHMHKEIIELLYLVDGITVTVHEQTDVDDFNRLNFWLLRLKTYKLDNNKTLRLNQFAGTNIYMQDDSLWNIQSNMVWIEDCPLPKNEEIMKLRIMF